MIPSLPRRNTRRGFYFQKDVGLFDAYDSTVYVSDSLLKYAKPYAVEEIIKNL